MKHAFITFLFISFLCISFAAHADDTKGTNRIVGGIVQYNVSGYPSGYKSEGLRLELRLGGLPVWRMHPWIGIDILPNSAYYAGGGLESDIDLSDHWVMTLQSGLGVLEYGTNRFKMDLYPHEGLQFRSQLELAYRMVRDARIGVNIAHMSNAGTSMPNPGRTLVGIVFHIPLSRPQP